MEARENGRSSETGRQASVVGLSFDKLAARGRHVFFLWAARGSVVLPSCIIVFHGVLDSVIAYICRRWHGQYPSLYCNQLMLHAFHVHLSRINAARLYYIGR